MRLVFLARISPRKAHASIPYVFPDKYTSSTGFSISGVTYGTSDSRVSNFSVAALMVKMCGSAVDGGLDRSCAVGDIEDKYGGERSYCEGTQNEATDITLNIFGRNHNTKQPKRKFPLNQIGYLSIFHSPRHSHYHTLQERATIAVSFRHLYNQSYVQITMVSTAIIGSGAAAFTRRKVQTKQAHLRNTFKWPSAL